MNRQARCGVVLTLPVLAAGVLSSALLEAYERTQEFSKLVLVGH
jgi:hypothetical protein